MSLIKKTECKRIRTVNPAFWAPTQGLWRTHRRRPQTRGSRGREKRKKRSGGSWKGLVSNPTGVCFVVCFQQIRERESEELFGIHEVLEPRPRLGKHWALEILRWLREITDHETHVAIAKSSARKEYQVFASQSAYAIRVARRWCSRRLDRCTLQL